MGAAAGPSLTLIISILVLASSVSIMSTDLYAPSLPHLSAYFGTSEQMVKLTISLNLLAFGVAQLIQGPMSDRFGRRPVMLFVICNGLFRHSDAELLSQAPLCVVSWL